MATSGLSGNHSTTLMQKLDGELICGICLELFSLPIMLPCGHNFCHECIFGIIERGTSFSFISIGPPTSFNCPICQTVVNIDKVNQSGLLVNKALENIVDMYKSCAPVDIFDSAWNKDIEVSVRKCEEHGIPEDRFCDSCSVTLCSECEKTEHQSAKAKHRVYSLKHAVVSYQTEIADILTDLKKKLIPLNDRIHHLESIVRMIQDNQDSISKKLELSMSALMAHLRQRQEGLKCKLENEMQNKELPITEELDRCRSIKVNVQELMRKLSRVRLIQDTTLKFKMMKDICKQLTTVVCFDIDMCLRNPRETGTDIPVWELNMEEVMESVKVLDWKQGEQGDIKRKCKDAGIQTISLEDEDLKGLAVKPLLSGTGAQEKGSNCIRLTTFGNFKGTNDASGTRGDRIHGAGLPEHTRLDDNLFDEIDGDYPKDRINVHRLKENEAKTKFQKDRKADIDVTEVKSNQEKDRAKENRYVDEKQNSFLHLDSDKVLNGKNFESRPTHKIKGRSSLPLESTTMTENKNSNPQASVNRAKKSYSDKDLIKTECSYSPSNAEALAKFVARRKTLSPSKSSPSLKTLVTLSDTTEGEDLNLNQKKNTSSETVKALSETFVGAESEQDHDFIESLPTVKSVGELLSVKNNKERPDINSSAGKSEAFGKSNLEKEKIALEEPKQPGKTNKELDNVNQQSTKEKSELDITSSHGKVASNQPDITTAKKTENITKPDIANSKSEIDSMEEQPVSHHKLFSKQPIGVKLDFNLGLGETVDKSHLKRITQV